MLSFGLETAENKTRSAFTSLGHSAAMLSTYSTFHMSNQLPSYLCQPSDCEGGGFLSRVIDRIQAVGSDLHTCNLSLLSLSVLPVEWGLCLTFRHYEGQSRCIGSAAPC